MEYREFSAKTVDDAITEASVELGVTSDNLDIEVVTEGSSGLFGIFSRQAVIKARVKGSDKEAAPETDKAIKAEPKSASKNEKAPKKAVQKKEKKADTAEKITEAPREKKVSPASDKPSKEKKNRDSEDVKIILKDFLTGVLEKMNMPAAEVDVQINDEERTIDINIEGGSSDIIGKKGQTLDALQYLASIVANKEKEEYYRLKLDTKNYRERRAKTLENLAGNVAAKVKKTRHKVVLEPMNPYERRIIHAYLQSDKQVTTKSEGDEPNRRVVVYYKR